MAYADWVVFGGFVFLAALLGFLEIRYMARRDRDPEEEKKWPEWWEESPEDQRGHRIPRLSSWPGAMPVCTPAPAGAVWRSALCTELPS